MDGSCASMSSNVCEKIYYKSRFPPNSQVAQCVLQLGRPPPGRASVRYNIRRAAVHPPSIAVSVKYILNLVDAVIARSAPPGIEECLVLWSVGLERNTGERTHGFIAIPHIAWNTSAVWPVLTLTATGTCRPKRLQYTSG